MGTLTNYVNFSEKNSKFAQRQKYSSINTVTEFNNWYEEIKDKTAPISGKTNKSSEHHRSLKINTDNIFRGMTEAKYKLYTSAQRFWIVNELSQWSNPNKGYLEFVKKFVDDARGELLFQKVFDYYNIKSNQRDFPILSILQHYGAPTPLMDWSYDLDVALYFATEGVTPSNSPNSIDQYFSVYQIDKTKQRKNEFNNLIEWHKGSFPQLSSFYSWQTQVNAIFYISDFEDKPQISFKDERPITTLYNQNIIPQSGLFIFNPFDKKPLEECFNTNHFEDKNNLELLPFNCFNIKKDLAEYIRRKIKIEGITNDFIYPQLRKYCSDLVGKFLDNAVK